MSGDLHRHDGLVVYRGSYIIAFITYLPHKPRHCTSSLEAWGFPDSKNLSIVTPQSLFQSETLLKVPGGIEAWLQSVPVFVLMYLPPWLFLIIHYIFSICYITHRLQGERRYCICVGGRVLCRAHAVGCCHTVRLCSA